ncbi:hypothetical protein Poli38472_008784 [Pythium oligandrum]|uniref:Uncharacterized protein n=1 Tax=Pythium oligandrum TaxID=41045 RepID=A0A8K1C425_PYTOL|nr:hypothetical protein Poli38472_008784 [Pythium oligandrum]|eukprot:TMW56136.1 hypothetical protein Poli38472_008784 [Pythium oligandrum]
MESPAPSGNSRREKKKKTKHRRRADEDAEPTNQHEETVRTITYEQILQLPTFDPADDHDTMYNEDPFDSQLSRRRRNVQETAENKPLTKFYVENEISGEFFRVRFHPKRWSRLHDHSERSRSSTSKPGKEHEEHNQWSHGTLLRDVETALTLMCIGLLTGLSWLDALSLGAPDRFLAGLMTEITKIRLQNDAILQADRGLMAFQRLSLRLLQGAMISLVAAFIALLVASPAAFRLTYAHYTDANWCQDSQHWAESVYQSALTMLQGSAISNAVFLTIAWLLVCLTAIESTESMLVTKLQIQNPTHSRQGINHKK